MHCIKKTLKNIKSEPEEVVRTVECVSPQNIDMITSSPIPPNGGNGSASSQLSHSQILQMQKISLTCSNSQTQHNQKVILSPRMDFQRPISKHTTTIDYDHSDRGDMRSPRSRSPTLSQLSSAQQLINSPQIIITRASPSGGVGLNGSMQQHQHPAPQQQQVRVIKDGRFYDESRHQANTVTGSMQSPPPSSINSSATLSPIMNHHHHNNTRHQTKQSGPVTQHIVQYNSNNGSSCNQPTASNKLDEHQHQHQQQPHSQHQQHISSNVSPTPSSRKYAVVSRHVNVISSNKVEISTSANGNTTIFRAPVQVSSSSGPGNNSSNTNNSNSNCAMRPPPPPPPPKIKNTSPPAVVCNTSEEPSSSMPDLEFDGTTVLCRVCGDKASGFHYGVHSCEGCKGFFRRSIQQKIQYRPCTKNQQCSILRINRNRCQYCRLKKCIAVGMSRDAVRFGRVPKREKARILAAMQQSTQNRGQQRALATELDDQPRLLAAVLRAHMETCEFTKDKVTAMRQRARECPSYSMPTLLACPLNPAPELQSEQEFSQRFAHVIRGVIDFAGMIPGFQLLTQDDKFTLLKAGLFDALFVRLICMFDSSINSIICLNGQVMRRDAIQNGANARFLVDSTFNFAERMNSMNLTDTEIGLFCAIVLITPDRPGLRNIELIEKMYSRLKACLQTVIAQNRPDQPEFMTELLKTMPDLRTLSTLHTEKLVVFRTEHKELLRQQMWSIDDDQPSKSPGSTAWDNNGMDEIAKSPMGSVSSTESGDMEYSQSSLASSAPLLAATLSGACPLRHRANSGSSAEDIDIVGSHAHLTQNGLTITPVARTHAHSLLSTGRYRKLDSPTDSGIESGNEKAESTKTVSSGGGSSCSSPRSSVDDAIDEHHAAAAAAHHHPAQNNGSMKRQIVEDMPVLKRVLQAPPLYDTNSLMDEAYKPHKKFRALRHRDMETAEAEAHIQPAQITSISQTQREQSATVPAMQQSQLHMHLTRNTSSGNSGGNSSSNQHHNQPQQHSSLSSTHSVLAKSLMAEPRMTPEQMKRTDIIQNYIMRAQPASNNSNSLLVCASPRDHCPYTTTSSPASSSSNSNCSSPSTTTLTISSPPPPPPHAMRWQGQSVITTTSLRQQTPSPSSIAVGSTGNGNGYFQSPHSTSVSPPRPSPSAQSPRLLELQVDIADSQQPLNLSKKSPTPPPPSMQAVNPAATKATQQSRPITGFPVAADVTVTATTAPQPNGNNASGSLQVHKVLLEA